jgi:hypothetical protein
MKISIMGNKAIKIELIEWLTHLEDDATLNYLKIVKESSTKQDDWWNLLSDQQKSGIYRGLRDVDASRVVAHEDVKTKYGL